jgi:PD-(D/E)XK nuclease superfamily
LTTLLSKLWKHCSKGAKPREDFFSDIVAELFRKHPEFLCQWLGILLPANVTDPAISVRQHFSSPEGPEGFFDIFIRLREGDGEHHIVIESKIDTTAWDGQLEKYDAEPVWAVRP